MRVNGKLTRSDNTKQVLIMPEIAYNKFYDFFLSVLISNISAWQSPIV